MAYNLNNFSRQSVALNTGEVTVDGNIIGGPGMFTYRSATDTVAQIQGANYFAAEVVNLSPADIIMGRGSDGAFALQVLTVDRDAKTITTGSMGLTTTVGTANIADGAVTSAKLAANAVGSGQLATEVLQYVAVPLTAANINGMYAAPVELVPAPGAGLLLVLDKLQLLMTYDSAAYAAGGAIAVQYSDTANGAGVIASTTLANTALQATASTAWNFNAGLVPAPFADCVNEGLYLSNLTAAFTTGDSDMVAHCWYKIIPSA